MNFLASWYCVFRGLVLKMILSPIEAITSPDYEKVYKSNFLIEDEINAIKEIKITNKRKLVLNFLSKFRYRKVTTCYNKTYGCFKSNFERYGSKKFNTRKESLQ